MARKPKPKWEKEFNKQQAAHTRELAKKFPFNLLTKFTYHNGQVVVRQRCIRRRYPRKYEEYQIWIPKQ